MAWIPAAVMGIASLFGQNHANQAAAAQNQNQQAGAVANAQNAVNFSNAQMQPWLQPNVSPAYGVMPGRAPMMSAGAMNNAGSPFGRVFPQSLMGGAGVPSGSFSAPPWLQALIAQATMGGSGLGGGMRPPAPMAPSGGPRFTQPTMTRNTGLF